MVNKTQGGSTITQQLVKTALLRENNNKKIKSDISLWTEKILVDQILVFKSSSMVGLLMVLKSV